MTTKHILLPGDDIGLTLEKASEIDAFEATREASMPWMAAQ